jgi:hypothetical protein
MNNIVLKKGGRSLKAEVLFFFAKTVLFENVNENPYSQKRRYYSVTVMGMMTYLSRIIGSAKRVHSASVFSMGPHCANGGITNESRILPSC